MSGTTFGRHHPYDACGPYGTLHPNTPISPSTSIDLMNHSTTPGPGPLHSARPGTPYDRSHEAPGVRGAPGLGARRDADEPDGRRARSADGTRGLPAARAAQERPDGAPDGRRQPDDPCGPGAKSGQVSGSGDDIAVTDSATGATEGAPGAGDEPDSHAYGTDGPTGSGFGGGTGNGGRDGDGPGRSHPTGGDFGGEDDLRRLLHSRVADLEPAPDALEQLRRAVPARRQRRRHAVVGAAAALLLGGTSIPAMVHVAHLAGSSEERPANAAGSTLPQGGAEGAHGEGTEQAGPVPAGKDGEKRGEDKPADKGRNPGKRGAGHGAGAGTPAPDETMDVTSPVCGREQLGQGTSTVGTADATGRVYGAFRVVNTSGAACSVEGGGSIGLVAQGSTSPDRVHVVDHTSGDEATGLPDPATTPDQLVLKPGQAYEVKFAWIPESGGGTTGCANPGPSPTPEASKDPGQSPDAATPPGDGGGEAGGGEGPGDGGSAPGSIVLSHTPEAGEPAAADAKVTDACAGTVYRTEALAAP
ncbi:hypothetical protein OG775_32430 [Streptomyces platensis]|uniref:hypothetical protein n=1 Tax=Streptomyces platensis TaxID=58346 RepID=UPI002250C707|nr:hypothetical protein [Streptomyces platensis]MCX4639766.1 hypothetical protein [Streptomyces platensis]